MKQELLMHDDTLSKWGATLLRVSLGVMYLTHGVVLKVFMYGVEGTAAFFGSIGFPPFTAYPVIAVEAIAGVLLVLNVRARWVALGLIPILIGATWHHAGNGWVFSNAGGGWEYPLFLIVVSVVVALQAPGRAVMSVPGRATVSGAA
jgi:putative oxidoreductase